MEKIEPVFSNDLNGHREIAQIIDFLISFIIFSFCLYLTKALAIDKPYADIIIVLFPSLYFVFSDGLTKGQSLGKRIFNISVINKNTGEYCSFERSFVRNFFTPFTGVFDVIIIVFKKRRRLGDLFAKTTVIKNS
ncbi:MAG: RDD family protein [Alteromonadaceae bacterium]|nr:RDD family protein [Alteromonadaceae bacterium]